MKKLMIAAVSFFLMLGSISFAQTGSQARNGNGPVQTKSQKNIATQTKTSGQTLQSTDCDGTQKKIHQQLKDGSNSGTGNKYRGGKK